MEESYRKRRSSRTGGETFPRINCLPRCTAAENFTLQGEILFESGMVECKAIRLIQKTPKGFPRGGSCPRSGLMRQSSRSHPFTSSIRRVAHPACGPPSPVGEGFSFIDTPAIIVTKGGITCGLCKTYGAARQAAEELLQAAHLETGDIFVVGCSSSEIMGGRIGKDSSMELPLPCWRACCRHCRSRASIWPPSAVSI